jgi:parvulin-like peptidyl-prolyl isomerase
LRIPVSKKSFLLALSVVFAVSACGGGGGGATAATVDGTEISVSDVEAVPFQSNGAMPQNEFAQYLTLLIQWQVIEDAAADEFDIAPTEQEVETELQTFLDEQTGGMAVAEFAELQGISEETVRRAIRLQMVQERVAEELGSQAEEPTEDELAASMREAEAGATEVCVRHFLVATEEEAQDALQRIEDGEEFESVATEVSLDTASAQQGGDLGCAPAGTYVPEFRDAAVEAEIDAITDPVETTYGFHVLLVYDRTEPAPEDLPTEDEVRESLTANAGFEALEAWATEKLEGAEVTVDEEYGTWVTDPQPLVQPPAS